MNKCVNCGNKLEMEIKYNDGEPCNHKGCLNHITRPGEVCGRIAGRGEYRGELRECKQARSDILGRSYAAIF